MSTQGELQSPGEGAGQEAQDDGNPAPGDPGLPDVAETVQQPLPDEPPEDAPDAVRLPACLIGHDHGREQAGSSAEEQPWQEADEQCWGEEDDELGGEQVYRCLEEHGQAVLPSEEEMAADCQEQEEADATGQAEEEEPPLRPNEEPRLGTAAFYDKHRHEPVFAGAQLTVEQVCWQRLHAKQQHRIRDIAFSESVRFLKEVELPQPNLMPPSIHLIRKLMGVEAVEKYEYHVCINEDYSWPQLSRKLWPGHRNDRCPVCDSKRFKDNMSRLEPEKVYYDFGFENVLRSKFFSNPEWAKLRGTRRDTSTAGLYGADIARRTDTATNGVFTKPTSSAYEIGFDFGQIFNFSFHSTGILVLRCHDTERGKADYCAPLIIIPGPREPQKTAIYLQRTLRALQKFGPDGPGVEMTYPQQQGDGSYRMATLRHHAFLTGGAADTPARGKLGCQPGVAAYLACPWCWMEGVKLEGSRATRFLGYARPVKQTLKPEFRGLSMRVGDPRLQKLDEQQHEMGRRVQRSADDAQLAGCTGLSPIPAALRYVSYGGFWIVPLAHAALYGACNNFWTLALAKYTKEQDRPLYVIPYRLRKIMRQRGASFRLPSDIGRGYRCILAYRASWLMDEWLSWLEFYSLHVVDTDVLSPEMQQMWEALRSALLHYFRPGGQSATCAREFSLAASERAHASLVKYAKLAEEHLPPAVATFNLHILICRLLQQERYRGSAAKDLELWVERAVQRLKANVKYRTTQHPEKLFVLSLLTDDALQRLRVKRLVENGNPLKIFDEWVPKFRATPLSGPGVNQEDASSRSLLMGQGKEAQEAALEQLRQLVVAFLERERPAGWHVGQAREDVHAAQLYRHTSLHLRAQEVVHSVQHTAAYSRCGFFAQLHMINSNNRDEQHVAEIQHYLRVVLGERTLRLAVCKIWESRQRNGMLVCNLGGQVRFPSIAVAVDSLDRKLISARAANGKTHFLRYSKLSALG